MALNTKVSVDVRNLVSVRVAKFEVKYGPPKHVEVLFEIQSEKSRGTMRATIAYGKFPTTDLAEGTRILMDATEGGELKDFDVIKQRAWDVVMHTTDVNKASGTGTHSDVSWSYIKTWTLQETTKPSISQTINTM